MLLCDQALLKSTYKVLLIQPDKIRPKLRDSIESLVICGVEYDFWCCCRLGINTLMLQPGEQHAMLQVVVVYSSNDSSILTCNVLLVLSGPAQSGFSSVQRLDNDSVSVAASVSLEIPADSLAVSTNVTTSSSGKANHLSRQALRMHYRGYCEACTAYIQFILSWIPLAESQCSPREVIATLFLILLAFLLMSLFGSNIEFCHCHAEGLQEFVYRSTSSQLASGLVIYNLTSILPLPVGFAALRQADFFPFIAVQLRDWQLKDLLHRTIACKLCLQITTPKKGAMIDSSCL